MYERHSHDKPDGGVHWHTHLLDEFEAEDPHTWEDHLRGWGWANDKMKQFKAPEPTHRLANRPDGLEAGSYKKMRRDYETLARGMSNEALEFILFDGRRDEWAYSQDLHKRAVCDALRTVRAERASK